MIKNFLGAVLAALALVAIPSTFLSAQTYPTSNPTYIPTAIGAVQSVVSTAAPATIVWNLNGLGTGTVRLTGTYTGLTATLQVTNDRSASPTWSSIGTIPMGSGGAGGRLVNLTSNGSYLVNLAGQAQLRLNITAMSTGTVNATFAGSQSSSLIAATLPPRVTYSAIKTGLAPAASATDFITLTGSATATVRLQRVECFGVSTAAATADVQLLVRSTANTAGTSAAMTAVPHDSNDPASSATALAYTANPTLGTLVGSGLRSGKLTTNTVAASAFVAAPLVWTFGGSTGTEEVVLRGITQVLALNGNAASFTAGASLNCALTWTEE